MGLKTLIKEFETFSTGVVTDIPHTEIPDTALFNAINAVYFKDGNVASRGGIYKKWVSSAAGPRRNGSYTSIGSYKTTKSSSPEMLCAVSYASGRTTGNRIVFEPWNAFATSEQYTTIPNLDSLSSSVETNGAVIGLVPGQYCGKTFDYYGDMGVPIGGPIRIGVPPSFFKGQNAFAVFSGNPESTSGEYSHYVTSFASTATVQVTSSNSTITFASVPTITPALPTDPIGKFIYITDGTNEYIGKIIKVTSSSAYVVSPTPTRTFTASPLAANAMVRISNIASPQGWNVETGGGAIPAVATSGCVFQNRVVLASAEPVAYLSSELVTVARANVGEAFYTNMRTQDSTTATIKPINSVCWSSIRTEPTTAVNGNVDGEIPLLRAGWPKSQYVTLDTRGISAIVPIDVNNLLVLCVDKVFMLSGTLGTILPNAAVNNSDFNIRTLSTNYSCSSDVTVQVTPYGIFFADRDSIYVTDGYKFVDVLEGKISDAYQSQTSAIASGDTRKGSFEPSGSAFVNGNYILLNPLEDDDGNNTASICVNAAIKFAVSYFTFESDSGGFFPNLAYTAKVASNGNIVGISTSTLNVNTNTIVNFDEICSTDKNNFDCFTVGNFETQIITKAFTLTDGKTLSRMKKGLINFNSYQISGKPFPSSTISKTFFLQKGVIDNASGNIASVTVQVVIPSATTTDAGSVFDSVVQRVDTVSGSLPDSQSTALNSNIGLCFYYIFIVQGGVFLLNGVSFVYNSLNVGRLNR